MWHSSYLNMLLVALILIPYSTVQADPIEWPESEGGNGHYYELVEEGLTWFQARDAANSRSWMDIPGHLVTMGSSEEDYWCWQQFGVSNHGYWLGGYQPEGTAEPAEGWLWETGETWSYTGWGAMEPNDVDEEDCLLGWFSNFTGWNDGSCDEITSWGYIVEYEPEIVADEVITWGAVKASYNSVAAYGD